LPHFRQVTIVGVGLIGGSIGLAIKKKNLSERVTGVGHRRESINLALRIGAIDEGCLDLSSGVRQADLTIFGTAVSLIPELARKAMPFFKSGSLLTDVGSTKAQLCGEIRSFLRRDLEFVGCHPLAGSEKRGVKHAKADLFEEATCILTPPGGRKTAAAKRLKDFWESLGARVVFMSPEKHDRIAAEVSHLPHLIAGALVLYLSEEAEPYIASGFRDATRIARSDSLIWRDIFLTNRAETLAALERFERHLSRLRSILEKEDYSLLEEILRHISTRRREMDKKGRSGG